MAAFTGRRHNRGNDGQIGVKTAKAAKRLAIFKEGPPMKRLRRITVTFTIALCVFVLAAGGTVTILVGIDLWRRRR